MESEIILGESCKIKNFWNMLGPCFASKKITKELGYPMYDNPKTVWFLCVKDSILLGFCAMHICNKKIKLNHDYVFRNFRRRGIYKNIFLLRLKHALSHKKTIEVVSKNVFQFHLFEQSGFKKIGQRGQYYIFRRAQNDTKRIHGRNTKNKK